jgi:hypothetical protein
MITQVPQQLASCLLRLNSPEMKPFIDALQSERKLYMDTLVVTLGDSQVIGRVQGRVQQLDEILNLVAKANTLVGNKEPR